LLVLFIPRKESVKNENIYVYVQPLIEDLEELWKGVKAYDVARPRGLFKFTLRATCMIILHMAYLLATK
jgi:hypothetical protein